MSGGDINSSISAMLPTNEPFVVSNTSSVYNDSGTSNTSVGMEDKFQQLNSSTIGLMVAFHSLAAGVILIGNLLVLIIISKRKDLQVRMFIYDALFMSCLML